MREYEEEQRRRRKAKDTECKGQPRPNPNPNPNPKDAKRKGQTPSPKPTSRSQKLLADKSVIKPRPTLDETEEEREERLAAKALREEKKAWHLHPKSEPCR